MTSTLKPEIAGGRIYTRKLFISPYERYVRNVGMSPPETYIVNRTSFVINPRSTYSLRVMTNASIMESGMLKAVPETARNAEIMAECGIAVVFSRMVS